MDARYRTRSTLHQVALTLANNTGRLTLKRRFGLRKTMPLSFLNRISHAALIFGIATKAFDFTCSCTITSAIWRAFSKSKRGHILVASEAPMSTNQAKSSSRSIEHLTGAPCKPRRLRSMRLGSKREADVRPTRKRSATKPLSNVEVEMLYRSHVTSRSGTLPAQPFTTRRNA